METQSTTIRILKSSKERLSSILTHDETYSDAVEFLLYCWQHPKSVMNLRKARTVTPRYTQEEKNALNIRISK